MSKLDFVKKLYKGKNCYSDHMCKEELQLLHIPSSVEQLVSDMISKGKIIFLTGNPGDGKTFIIKAIDNIISTHKTYVQTDLNNESNYQYVVDDIIKCYIENRSAVIAVNEYPFLRLCRQIKEQNEDIYEEIQDAKKSAITYDNISSPLIKKIAVIDLNERNFLTTDNHLLDELFTKLQNLLKDDAAYYPVLQYNINAISYTPIKIQLIALLELAASECEHFAVRDILGAISFILAACTTEEYSNQKYYNAIFTSDNKFLMAIKQYDPIYLSHPDIDEKLWNGEITEGWLIDIPLEWPNSKEYEDDVDKAVECFKNVKRKYYFENIDGQSLFELQPNEIKKSIEIFSHFEAQRKKIKEHLIRSINKLFLPSSNSKNQLFIWTTHRYDMSIEVATAVSSRHVDSSELEIKMPRPADWLKGLEYQPNHITMKPKNGKNPVLTLDVDFLRTLDAVENGYPVSLLAPQYEQTATMFLQQLNDNGFAEENDDGEIIIASRTKSYKKSVFIQDGKYSFEEDNK